MVQRHVVRGVRWGDGPVVYLVHGWGGELSQLRAFVAPLVAAGHRVVAFDGPSHGASEAGTSGPGRSDAVALGRALDAVGARFGQPAAIVAHSMGALSSMLALRDGWLSTPRLALIAPATDLSTYLDRFFETWRIGPRSRRRFEERLEHRVGYAVDDFDVARISTDIARPDLLVVHDAGDRSTTYQGSVDLVQGWPGARLMTAQGLGHRRVLTDQHVVGEVVSFVTVREATVPSDLTA
jgi:pimeloyl-ACP methyl ester carboxylesterase